MKHIQIIDNDCFHDDSKYPWVKKNYPLIHKEVAEHDSRSSSSWYDVTDEAFEEYERYFAEMQHLGIFREDAKVKVI